MSRKKGEQSLIIPGRKFWEIWEISGTEPSVCKLVSEVTSVHELSPLPSGETSLFFPLNQLTFSPFSVETTDPELFSDLIESHWEQEGIRLDQDGGTLRDYSIVKQTESETLLAPYILATQTEHDLPTRAQAHFDISPHAYAVEGNKLIFREELGQWIMSVYVNGIVLFALILGRKLDEDSIRDARLTLMQLEMQGTCPSLYEVVLWDDKDNLALIKGLGKPVHTRSHPLPVPPKTWSKLLPADVGAERRKKENARRIKAIVIALVLAYLGTAAYFYKDVLSLQSEVNVLKEENKVLEEPFKLLEAVKNKWTDLEPPLNSSLWPDELLWRCYNARPDENSIRFTFFEVRSNEQTGKPDSIMIKGTSPSSEFVTKFGQRLKSPQFKLDSYEWKISTPTPPTAKDNNLWTFSFEAVVPAPAVTPEAAQ